MPSISNYICVKCEKEMRPEKNGVYIEEHMNDGSPYKIWHADLWKCPVCGTELICGFAINPTAHHFEDHYSEEQKRVEYHIR